MLVETALTILFKQWIEKPPISVILAQGMDGFILKHYDDCKALDSIVKPIIYFFYFFRTEFKLMVFRQQPVLLLLYIRELGIAESADYFGSMNIAYEAVIGV